MPMAEQVLEGVASITKTSRMIRKVGTAWYCLVLSGTSWCCLASRHVHLCSALGSSELFAMLWQRQAASHTGNSLATF